jgi:hypothetical protein
MNWFERTWQQPTPYLTVVFITLDYSKYEKTLLFFISEWPVLNFFYKRLTTDQLAQNT